MYDKPPSSSSASTLPPPPPPFVHGGEVQRHNTSPWMGNVSFDMPSSQRSGINGRGSSSCGGGGDFSRAQGWRYHYQHPQLQAGEQQQQATAPVAGPVGSTGFEGASSVALLPPMTPASAAGAFAQSQSPGRSTSFSSSSAPSPVGKWGTTSSMDDSHRYARFLSGAFFRDIRKINSLDYMVGDVKVTSFFVRCCARTHVWLPPKQWR